MTILSVRTGHIVTFSKDCIFVHWLNKAASKQWLLISNLWKMICFILPHIWKLEFFSSQRNLKKSSTPLFHKIDEFGRSLLLLWPNQRDSDCNLRFGNLFSIAEFQANSIISKSGRRPKFSFSLETEKWLSNQKEPHLWDEWWLKGVIFLGHIVLK